MPDITKISGTVKLNFLVRKEVIISIHKILYSTAISKIGKHRINTLYSRLIYISV